MASTSSIDIRNFTRGRAPRLPFAEVAQEVLPGWDISLAIAGETRARSLNRALRGKDYVPNVLSYVVGKRSGEIILCPAVAKREAPDYGLKPQDFLLYLFIHGLLHLKGLPHGATMERYERAIMARHTDITSLSKWHDASQPASISERTKRRSSSLKK